MFETINKAFTKIGVHLSYFSGYSEHPVNRLLSIFSLRLSKSPAGFYQKYMAHMRDLDKDSRGFKVIKGRYYYPSTDHPKSYVDCECEFSARHLQQLAPKNILDIGSYRQFILGMLAGYDVTTIDIRARKTNVPNEHVITGDAT